MPPQRSPTAPATPTHPASAIRPTRTGPRWAALSARGPINYGPQGGVPGQVLLFRSARPVEGLAKSVHRVAYSLAGYRATCKHPAHADLRRA